MCYAVSGNIWLCQTTWEDQSTCWVSQRSLKHPLLRELIWFATPCPPRDLLFSYISFDFSFKNNVTTLQLNRFQCLWIFRKLFILYYRIKHIRIIKATYLNICPTNAFWLAHYQNAMFLRGFVWCHQFKVRSYRPVFLVRKRLYKFWFILA
jgi:hypothetical protein